MQFTNKHRAARCRKVLKNYGSGDTELDCLIDLLADARHYCDSKKLSYAELDRIAYQHYATEVVEERGGVK